MSTKSEHDAVVQDEKDATARHAAKGKEAPKKGLEERVAELERQVAILSATHSVSTGTPMAG